MRSRPSVDEKQDNPEWQVELPVEERQGWWHRSEWTTVEDELHTNGALGRWLRWKFSPDARAFLILAA